MADSDMQKNVAHHLETVIWETYRSFEEANNAKDPMEDQISIVFPSFGDEKKEEIPSQEKPTHDFGKRARPEKFGVISLSQTPRKFAMALKLLQIIHSNLTLGNFSTRRDLYYRDVDLFGNQRNVDRLIDFISKYLGISMNNLAIIPAQKGLVYADLDIIYENGSKIEIRRDNSGSGCLIPLMNGVKHIMTLNSPECILIVEKEACFRDICRLGGDKWIVVTGKGFPDKLTRQFLDLLHHSISKVVIYGVVDCDPHGISILNTYQRDSEYNVEYLGVELLDFKRGWIYIKDSDVRLALSILRKLQLKPLTEKETKQLQRIMFFQVKAEMNVVGNRELGLTVARYIKAKLECIKPKRE